MEEKTSFDEKIFITHFAAFSSGNVLLIIINLMTGADTLWFLGPLLGWSIGITIHFFGVFIFDKIHKKYMYHFKK